MPIRTIVCTRVSMWPKAVQSSSSPAARAGMVIATISAKRRKRIVVPPGARGYRPYGSRVYDLQFEKNTMATPQHPETFVRWLRQVAPYVHAFRGRTFVVAFGGEMFAERARFTSFIHDVNLLAALGIRLVLAPGARPQIEAELKAKGLRSRYAQGLRITDQAG